MQPESIKHRIYRTAIFAAALGAAITASANAADLALMHARIYPSPDAASIADGTILIHDGRIAAVAAFGAVRVPRDAKRIDVRGGTVTAGFWKKIGEPDQELQKGMDASVQQVSAYAKAGGQILFGTDVGYTDAYDTTEEYRQLGRALDWRQILKSLTAAPAERFGYAVRKGRLAPGMDADLVVLDGDPSKEVTAFARVRLTLRAGRTIYDAKSQ